MKKLLIISTLGLLSAAGYLCTKLMDEGKAESIKLTAKMSAEPFPENRERYTRANTDASAFAKQAREAMSGGNYEVALAKYAQAREVYTQYGLEKRGDSYHDPEMECFFQLGRYGELIENWDRRRGGSPTVVAAVGLALLKVGREADAKSVYSEKDLLMYMQGEYRDELREKLPGIRDKRHLEASFYLIRGVSFSKQANPACLPELVKADQLLPRHSVISGFLAMAHRDANDYVRAKAAAQYAVELPGAMGGIVHTILNHGNETEGWYPPRKNV